MTDNNLGAASRFGTETQKQIVDNQRRANSSESGHVNKCTIIVLTTLNANGKFSYLTADEQLREKVIEGKVLDRLPNLLASTGSTLADTNSAYYILHPNNGAPTRIDERIKVGEGDAVVVSYTVNKTVSEMHGSLSLALFSAGADDLLDLAASSGIHAIAIVEEAKAYDFIRALAAQVESMQTVNISSIDETEGAFDKPVIDYSALPGNPVTVLSGAVRTFIMQTTGGEVFAAIPNNGELNVKQENNATPVDLEEDFDQEDEVADHQGESEDDVATGTDLFGYKAETLSIEQMKEALEAMSYDLSAMSEDAIRESFETEQNIWLAEGDSEEDADGEEADAEDGDDEEADEEDSFDPVQYLASLLVECEFDRDALKVLIRSQELKVMKSDTVETLTAKLLELVEDASEQEMVELVSSFIEVLGERGIEAPALVNALSSDEEDEEDLEDEEEDGEEEDADEEEDDADDEEDGEEVDAEEDDEDAEEESDEIADQIAAVTDPLDYFQFPGGSLTAEQRAEAVAAMGEDTDNLNIVQVMKAFARIQAQTGAIEVADEEDSEEQSSEEAVRDLLGQYDDATVQHVAENIGILVDECETVDEMIDAILAGGSEDDIAAIEAIAELHGVETDLDIGEMEWEDALLLVLPAFLDQDNVEDEDEDEDLDDAEDEEEAEDDSADEVEAVESSSNDNLKFLKAVDTKNAVGPMVSVEMDQTLIINFTLTDGNTYRDIESELADVNGFNYRFPFNLGKPGKAPGSMHVPAQSLLDMIERTGTARFLTDPKTFDVAKWAESLEATLNEEISASLYEGRIEDGLDPYEAGIVVGDFIDEDELAEAAELGHLDPDQFDEMRGDHLPIASLYNAHSRVRPVQVETAYVALHTTVLNVAVPGFWGDTEVARMVQAAVNRVISLAETVDGVKVYAGFTLESAALLNNDSLYQALGALREMDGVQSYSAADAANFDDAEDVIEVASALDSRDLPLAVLSGGLAAATFDNGGDLTVLVPCTFEDEEVDEEDEDEGDDE